MHRGFFVSNKINDVYLGYVSLDIYLSRLREKPVL